MLRDFWFAFIALFVALDILGTLPIYLGMTRTMGAPERRRTLNVSVFVAFGVAIGFLFLGVHIFNFLGITLPDFRIAGGIVLLLISLADLLGYNEAEARISGSTGVVPLAVPLITGPALLATLLLQAESFGYPITLTALFLNFAFAWLALHESQRVTRIIGRDGTVVFSKIASLLLAALAVSMIRVGIIASLKS